jgi:hypothetical protein
LYAVIGSFMGRISRAKKAIALVGHKCNHNSGHLFTIILNSQWSVVSCQFDARTVRDRGDASDALAPGSPKNRWGEGAIFLFFCQ